jgi:hypothetical protein
MTSKRPHTFLLALILLGAFMSRTAFGDSCDKPPAPRYKPGQVDHYPHGADVISCSRPAPGKEAWHIEYPSVDRRRTDYPAITFNAGDTLTLSASGCVQTGGHRSTWKRYVNPDNGKGHLDTQYYGTVLIPGVTGDTVDQTIQHWIGPPFTVPRAGHLVLGYVDDGGLGDNGYHNHDNGANNQCVNQSKVTVNILIDHNPRPVPSCPQWLSFVNTPVAPDQPELARVASLLRAQAEVPLGLPITADVGQAAITHFQVFQDGSPGKTSTPSNRPLNSAELHSDGCVYVAVTPIAAPIWYPVDLYFDSSPQSAWQARPWDVAIGNRSFSTLKEWNHDLSRWLPTFVPGYCVGAGSSWRWTAPRWIKMCAPPRLPPSAWTAANMAGFPVAEGLDTEVKHSGAMCNWIIKQPPSRSDGCIHFNSQEWVGVNTSNSTFVKGVWRFLTAEGTVTNSFLSGGDFSGDHSGMPDGHFVGVHTDVLAHNDAVDNCPDLANKISGGDLLNATGGEHCVDWEVNLLPDPSFRHLLAANESKLNDRSGGDCQSQHAEYREGNQHDVGSSKPNAFSAGLGVEGEQWYYPLGFRPEPGDRAVVRGVWIVDCGHPDWHTELHPASLLESSYLQTSDYASALGATWNRPLRLTDNWRSITGGVPAVVTKVIVSPVFAESKLEIDVWPPARPCAGARLMTAREDVHQNVAWSGITIASETPLPADGNPNHLHVTFSRNGSLTLRFGGDGDVQNPDQHLTFFTAYMAWWAVDAKTCHPPGGPGTGSVNRPPVPRQLPVRVRSTRNEVPRS